MELRPFRSVRYAPATIEMRGLDSLIAPPRDALTGQRRRSLETAAPENAVRLLTDGETASETFREWLAAGVLLKERRPGLWTYRQTREGSDGPVVVPLLIGLVRIWPGPSGVEVPAGPAPEEAKSERLALLRAARADFEPSLLVTRAPLSAALSTMRRPELSATDPRGVRHDLFRVNDFAQHVELQGVVKSAEAQLAAGRDRFEAARSFASEEAAVKLPGAKYKLCAIVDERSLPPGEPPPEVWTGLFAVALEDPVY